MTLTLLRTNLSGSPETSFEFNRISCLRSLHLLDGVGLWIVLMSNDRQWIFTPRTMMFNDEGWKMTDDDGNVSCVSKNEGEIPRSAVENGHNVGDLGRPGGESQASQAGLDPLSAG